MSRICEEFHCLPSQAVRELERMPADYVWQVIESRHYAHAKAQVSAAHEAGGEALKHLPQTELYQLVQVHEMEIAEEDHDG